MDEQQKPTKMALSKKKDSIISLLGALRRLVSHVKLPLAQWMLIYNLLDAIHKFIEKQGE